MTTYWTPARFDMPKAFHKPANLSAESSFIQTCGTEIKAPEGYFFDLFIRNRTASGGASMYVSFDKGHNWIVVEAQDSLSLDICDKSFHVKADAKTVLYDIFCHYAAPLIAGRITTTVM